MASHTVAALLKAGYRVRACVRNPDDEVKTAHLKSLEGAVERLTFHRGELLEPGSYDEALNGVAAVLHMAAVVEIGDSKDPEAEIVRPSIDGVRNVLASADKAGTVQRFVQTSSIIATFSYTKPADTTFSEADWNEASTVANGDAYGYSKVMAEREAHNHGQGKSYDVVALNPAVVLGPSLCKAHTKASVVVIRQMIFGNAQPTYKTGFVDVRDVADAHVKALSLAGAAEGSGPRRFIICSDTQCQLAGLEEPLQRLFPDYKINCVSSQGPLTNLILGIPLLWRAFTTDFRRTMASNNFSFANAASKTELGLSYRPLDDTLRDSVTSMVDSGFCKARVKKA